MLPRRQKLSRKSFPSQNTPKTTWRGLFLCVRSVWSKESSPPKFAVVISKKQLRLAVQRNKIRRMIYQAIHQHQSDFPRYLGAKCIITLQKNASLLTKEDVRTEIDVFFKER